MDLGALSIPYQGKGSEQSNALKTVSGITGSAGSPIGQTRRYHVEF